MVPFTHMQSVQLHVEKIGFCASRIRLNTLNPYKPVVKQDHIKPGKGDLGGINVYYFPKISPAFTKAN